MVNVNSSQAVALQGKQHSSAKSFSPGAIYNHYDDDDDVDDDDVDDDDVDDDDDDD